MELAYLPSVRNLIYDKALSTRSEGHAVKHIWTDSSDRASEPTRVERAALRRDIALPARLTWKDQRGTVRFASVVTRDLSEIGAFVECHSPVSIPLYRLVQFQVEAPGRDADGLPATLRSGRVLAAVYRVRPAKSSGARQGLALRLMVDPKRLVAEAADVRATA